MTKLLLRLVALSFLFPPAFGQLIKIKIVNPDGLKGRKAILLTREKGFAATVHSIKLGQDSINLQMEKDLVPNLYQMQVSQLKGSLYFFLENGVKIQLDTTDLSKSVASNSKSNEEWQVFWNNIQKPSDDRLLIYTAGEGRARNKAQADSIDYWRGRQAIERLDLQIKTSTFIQNNLSSFVSLYLLKVNWYAFKNLGIFEKLDPSLARHRTYKFLKEKRRGNS
ncbi:DUF4369 domain-containing protein [Dyadobacter chenwenxiniae]|uniref:DUF4369 domain-containing protein n=1 Tax=Dyadobacter chenwenxiniae TaxID=2906456 RepID=A0A9X1PGW7_9BACT|nr:DUF4369 domain-containing protein [Dyadobacter chenwenxiniae]MCF0060005.1 DUF4369 domain-containing protein [Dyadobacter chenwenxiniae]UON85745.1 DUF4369 domain-containing protein [Dyadobacter chenwenxiniae]